MNDEKKKYSKWTLSFGAIGGLVGLAIAQFGNFNGTAILGGLFATLILAMINLIYVMNKSDTTPEFDERTTHNILKFYAYASNAFILLSIMLLTFLLMTGVEQLSLTVTLLILFAYFSLSGTMALIISRK